MACKRSGNGLEAAGFSLHTHCYLARMPPTQAPVHFASFVEASGRMLFGVWVVSQLISGCGQPVTIDADAMAVDAAPDATLDVLDVGSDAPPLDAQAFDGAAASDGGNDGGESPSPVDARRSLMITNPAALNAIEALNQGTLGIQLKQIGRAAIEEWATRGSRYTASQLGAWVAHPFDAAARESDEHNSSPFEERLGIRDDSNPYQHVLDLWGAELRGGNAGVGGGPFRLLAVVNRMDIAGDRDHRGLIDGARDPRNFGEARLIYGLVDRARERNTGRPFPMTFIIEYRLPALDAALEPMAPYPASLLSAADPLPAWRQQMRRWGQLWQQLSTWDPQSSDAAEVAAFQAQLVRIVRAFANPENFTGLRSNVAIRRADAQPEFELREWYIVRNNQWSLIPRKPRDEPYRCVGEGGDLAALIGYFWDAARGDLRMDRINEGALDGFNIPRTPRDAPELGGYTLGDPPRGCRLGGGALPFEMEGTDTQAARITAPFARIRENFVWSVQDRAGDDIPEARRHQFAIRTCSGCHSREAGIFGFHVNPRLQGEESRLSPFLTGGAGAAFSNEGVDYDYAELSERVEYLRRAVVGDPTLVPYEMLYRDDVLP